MSSPILFVFGDDRVIRYTGAGDIPGDASLEDFELEIFIMFSIIFVGLWNL